MRKITCHCEQVFSADLPETVNLDESPEIIEEIARGSFLTCSCPACGAVLHTDLQTDVLWPSKNASIRLVPALERFSYLTGKKKVPRGFQLAIGYAELADRIAVIGAALDPLAVEAIKYHLIRKAQESPHEEEPDVYFERIADSGALEFHVFGLKKDEVAVTLVPFSLYEKIQRQIEENPQDELFRALKNGAYISAKNIYSEQND